MKRENMAGSAMLVLTALIWGGAFVAQSTAMDHIGALTFNAVRFFIGALVLLPVIALTDAGKKRRGAYEKPSTGQRRYLWISGVLCGFALGCATLVQQYAIIYTTVSKAGFITALYIVLVPVLSIFFGKKPAPMLWLCVAIAAVGLYFLCMTESFTISLGDGLAMVCSALFALQIMLVDPVYRRALQRRRLYAADRRSEADKPGARLAFDEPGVRIRLAVWSADPASDPLRTGDFWLRTCFRGNCSGPGASNRKENAASGTCAGGKIV